MKDQIIIILSGVLTTAIAWILGSRKFKADAQVTELDSVAKAIGIWRELATDLSAKVELLTVEVDRLREELLKAEVKIGKLTKLIEHEQSGR